MLFIWLSIEKFLPVRPTTVFGEITKSSSTRSSTKLDYLSCQRVQTSSLTKLLKHLWLYLMKNYEKHLTNNTKLNLLLREKAEYKAFLNYSIRWLVTSVGIKGEESWENSQESQPCSSACLVMICQGAPSAVEGREMHGVFQKLLPLSTYLVYKMLLNCLHVNPGPSSSAGSFSKK